MSDANLVLRFSSQGLSEVRKDLSDLRGEAVATAAAAKTSADSYVKWWESALAKEQKSLEAAWLAEKDLRQKTLADIQRIETQAMNERWKQEQAALKRAAAEKRAQDAEDLRWARAQAAAEVASAKAAAREKAVAEKAAAKEAADAVKAAAKEKLAAEKAADKEAAAAAKQAAKEKAAAEREAAQAAREAANAPSILDRVSLWATGLNQAIALVQRFGGVLKSFVDEAAKWEAMDLALLNLEGSGYAAKKAIDDLYQLAKAPAIDLQTAEHAYIKLRSVRIEGEEAEHIIKDFSNTVARGGGGSVQFQRVLEQLVQMQANGKVLNSDLKFMKNSMPELASLMQDAFGTTTAEGIRKAGVNAREFMQGILAEMDKLPVATQTLQSEMENLETAYSRFKASFVDTEWTKDFISSWTTVFERLTILLKAKAVDWAGLIRAAMKGEMGNTDQYTLNNRDEYINKAIRDAPRVFAKRQYDEMSVAEKAKAWISGQTTYVGANDFGAKRSDLTLKEFDPSRKTSGQSYNDYIRLLQSQRSQFSGEDMQYITAQQPKPGAANDPTPDEKKKKGSKAAWQLEDWERAADHAKHQTTSFDLDMKLKAKKDAEKEEKELNARADAEQKYYDEVDERERQRVQAEIDAAQKVRENYMSELEVIEKTYQDQHAAIMAATRLTADEQIKYEQMALNKRKNAQIDYFTSLSSQMLSSSGQLFDALAELEAEAGSKRSTTYKTLFAISKSFAIADASLQMTGAVAKAWNTPFPANMANVAAAMSAGASLISNITSLAYKGPFDKGGYIPYGSFGIAGENGAEIIQGPAHVTSTKDTARLLAGVGQASNSGDVKVSIHNYAGAQVTTSKGSDGSLNVTIEQMAEAVERRIAGGIVQGGGPVAQAMQGTYGVRR